MRSLPSPWVTVLAFVVRAVPPFPGSRQEMVDTEKVGPCIKAETRVTPVTSAHTLPAASQPQRDIQLQKAWCLVVHWGLKTISVYVSRFWRPEVPGQGAGRVTVWGGPASWFTDGRLLAVPSRGRRGQELSGMSSLGALIPFMRTLPL